MNTSSYSQNHLLVFLFTILIFIKLALIKHAPVINDEAYTLTIGRYFSLSYFDHPPLMTWISYLFHFFEVQKAYLFRIPHIIFGALTSLFLYKIGSMIYSRQSGVFAAILYFISPFFFFSGGFFIVPDGILNFSIAGATYFATKIIFGNENKSYFWFALGLLLAIAFLSKYQSYLFALALFIAFIIWKKEVYSGGHNLGNSSLEVSDGYLIAGAINRNSAILKLDKLTGAILFQKTFNNGGVDAFEHLAQTPTGILAVGYRNAEDPDNTFFTYAQGHISFLDNNGDFIRSQSINDYMSQGYRIKQAGLDYIIAGQSEDALAYSLIKITATGTILWNKTYGGNREDHCFGLDLGEDGSIFLTGHTLSGVVNWDTYTMKLDSDGVKLWEQVVGNPRGFDPQWIHDETWGIKATCDGGCIISAGTGDEYSYTAQVDGVSSDQWEAYIVKYDANGNLEWQATYNSDDFGQEGSWAAEDIDLTSDGGAIIAVDNGQFGFLKLAPF